MLSEELGAGAGDQNEEIRGHQQVIRNSSGSGEIVTCSILRSHCRKVYAAADIRAGHHGGYLCKTLRIAKGSAQEIIGEERADDSAECADKEHDQHTAGVLPYAAEVALQQQQGDSHRNDDAPYNIVIQRAVRGYNAEVCENHRHYQRDYGAGDLGGPLILLLKVY